MITPMDVYLTTTLDSVVGLLGVIPAVAVVVSLFIGACIFKEIMVSYDGGYPPHLLKLTKCLLVVGLIVGIVIILGMFF